MARVLILFAHPALQKSRIHRRLVRRAPSVAEVTLHDLYEAYPDFLIDVAREQDLLVRHEVVIFQHPLYWYGTPPLLKQWMDLVLEHGWAYGSEGTALRGRWLLPIVSAGGAEAAYRPGGYNGHTIRDFLLPVEQTGRLCGMHISPPWIVFGTHRLGPDDIEALADEYETLLRWIVDDGLQTIDPSALRLDGPSAAAPMSRQEGPR